MRTLLLALVLSAAAFGQLSTPRILFVTSDPVGACTPPLSLRYNITNGALWGCDGTWVAIGGGGSGTVTMGGDVTGLSSAATVAKIQGKAVSTTAPADQSTLVYVAADNQYEPTAVGTTAPPPAAATIGDFWVVRTSPTVLTIGQNCSVSFPCRVAFGTTTFQITAPATATISAGSATAYIYVSDAQVLSVGTNGDTVVCSGCTTVGSISAFPATAIPLWNWTASSGTWVLAGGTDQRTIVQKGADPLATYVLTTADTQLKNAVVPTTCADSGGNHLNFSAGAFSCGTSSSTVSPTTNQNIRGLGATFGSFQSGATALSSSLTACVPVYFAGTIQSVEVIGDVSGSATIDVKTVAHSSWTGTASASSITASATPALSSAARYTDSTLTGWTTTLAANTDVCFVMTSPTTVAGLAISLKVAAN